MSLSISLRFPSPGCCPYASNEIKRIFTLTQYICIDLPVLTQNPKLISPWMVEPHVFGIASVPLDIMRWGGGVVSEERFAPGTIATVLSRVLCGVVVFV